MGRELPGRVRGLDGAALDENEGVPQHLRLVQELHEGTEAKCSRSQTLMEPG